VSAIERRACDSRCRRAACACGEHRGSTVSRRDARVHASSAPPPSSMRHQRDDVRAPSRTVPRGRRLRRAQTRADRALRRASSGSARRLRRRAALPRAPRPGGTSCRACASGSNSSSRANRASERPRRRARRARRARCSRRRCTTKASFPASLRGASSQMRLRTGGLASSRRSRRADCRRASPLV
jgi:hypothetical protein